MNCGSTPPPPTDDESDRRDDYIPLDQLEAEGFALCDVLRRCPGAVLLGGFGGPCFALSDLDPLWGDDAPDRYETHQDIRHGTSKRRAKEGRHAN